MKAITIRPSTLNDRLTSDYSDDSGKYIFLKKFVDLKNNPVDITKIGGNFSVVVKQGKGDDAKYEICLINAITQNDDGTAVLAIATNGRNLDPFSPYTGYSTGETFDTGAELIVTNDAYAMSRFANLDEPAIFTIAPQSTASPIVDEDLTNKAYVDALLAGTITLTKNLVQGVAGEDIVTGQPIYFDTATNEWFLADKDSSSTITNKIIGIAQSDALTGNSIVSGILTGGVSSVHSGLTPGLPVYVGAVGTLTQTLFATSYTVGVAISATEIFVKTAFDYIPTMDEKAGMVGTQGTPSANNKFTTDQDYRLAKSGFIQPFFGFTIPTGWLACDGSLVSRSTYANLWANFIKSINTFTVSIATPGVITTPASHGLIAGDRVYFTTTGALPTGITPNTIYYVIATGLTSTQFQFSTTKGGSAVNTSGSQSGTHTLIQTMVGLGDGSTTFALPDLRGKMLVGKDTSISDFAQIGNTGGEKTHTLDLTEIPSHTHSLPNYQAIQNAGGPSDGVAGNTFQFSSGQNSGSSGGGLAHENMSPYGIVQWIIKY